MRVIFESVDQHGQKVIMRKRVVLLKNLDSVIEKLIKSRELFRFGPKKKTEDSHQR